MTTFSDIFKKSFLQNFSANGGLTASGYVLTLALALLLGAYIFFCYRYLTRRVFYSKTFNISLVAMAVITAAIILTIRSSVVVSLGMVGALSIVRFRTAVKDPMDLVFLYWSISVGIMVGAGQKTLALLLCAFATLAILVFNLLPVATAPMLLLVNARCDADGEIQRILGERCKGCTEKSRSISGGQLDLVLELRVNDGAGLVNAISGIDGVCSVNLMKHDGEVTF